MPALHCAMTSSGTEMMNSGAPITGRRRRSRRIGRQGHGKSSAARRSDLHRMRQSPRSRNPRLAPPRLDAGRRAAPSRPMADAVAPRRRLPARDRADWRALVDKTLGEAPFESLEQPDRRRPADRAALRGAAGAGRGLRPARSTPSGRGISRGLAAHPDPARANAEILRDLEGGAAARVIRIDPTGAGGRRRGLRRGPGPGASTAWCWKLAPVGAGRRLPGPAGRRLAGRRRQGLARRPARASTWIR